VHHRVYDVDGTPWDIPDELPVTLCETCHTEEYEQGKIQAARLLKLCKSCLLSHEMHELSQVLSQYGLSSDSKILVT